MNITVRFYSVSKDIAGVSEMHLVVQEPAILRDAAEMIYEELPALTPLRASIRFAIGVDYASLDAKLFDGCQISVIPPVQGG